MTAEILPFPKMPCKGSITHARWVALEKIHGAQLVIDVSHRGVRFGKRKSWLREDEAFFGWQLLRGQLTRAALSLHARLRASRLVLYGELFGGSYPHPDVPGCGLMPVQTGVWYAPDLHWALFEVRLLRNGSDVFLSFGEVSALASQLDLYTPPVLALGREAEVDRLSERFTTRVPDDLRLPPLNEHNLAEGLVIKPDVDMPAATYTATKRKIREMQEAAFDQSVPWDPSRPVGVAELVDLAERLTNGPRLASAASKVGVEDVAALADEVVLDVLLDLEQVFPEMIAVLPPSGMRAIEERIRAAISPGLPPPRPAIPRTTLRGPR